MANKKNVARKLFEDYSNNGYVYDPEYPNYGSVDELMSTIDEGFDNLTNESNYSNDDDLINDLTSLAEMAQQVLDADSIEDCLDKNQKDMVYAIIYDGHIHPNDLSDTELADVITEISNKAKIALRDYDL